MAEPICFCMDWNEAIISFQSAICSFRLSQITGALSIQADSGMASAPTRMTTAR